jgi:hypothetical protein
MSGSHQRIDDGEDVEGEPDARHDDGPSLIVRRGGVSFDFAVI